MAEPSIQTKYERLAQEYAKLRSNTTVLKKAVIDEKSIKAKLAEELKAAEMSQRKTKQELEALQFRNQQLAKRIEVLQDDLDKAQTAVNKKRGQGGAKGRGAAASGAQDIDQPDQALIIEQLQKTIEENARLNSELSESRTSFEAELRTLRDSNNSAVESVKRELHQRCDEYSKVQAQCALLQEEKRVVENQLIAKEAANQQLGFSIDDLQKKLAALQHRYDQFKLSVVNSAPAPLPASSPAAVETAAGPKEPALPPPSAQALLPCLQEAFAFSLRFVRGMKEWHENHARRLKLPFGPLRPTPKLMEAISKCTESASGLEETMVSIETALKATSPKLTSKQISDLHTEVHNYGTVLIDSLPFISQRIEDECALSFCPSSLSERNKEIISALSSLSSALSQVLPVVLQKAAVPTGEEGPGSLWCCVQLLQQCKQLARLFNRKVSLEQSLAELSEEVKAANEAMVHGLLVARTALEKLQGHLSGHAAFFSASGWTVAREILCGPSAGVSLANGPRSVSPVTSQEVEAVPRLQREVAALREQVRSLEQARDSLALEAQLERMRRGKENQRRCEVEKELQSFRSASPSASSLVEEESSSSVDLASSERETLIQSYYQEIVSKQQQELHLLTGVAENFKAEFENVRAQFLLSEKENSELKSAVASLTHDSKSISEDLESTRRNYETQLSTLTEHIADMNEKLIQRQDCIEALKRQVENKESPQSSRSASFSVVTSLFANTAKRK